MNLLPDYDLAELSDITDVSVRTVRYYIQQGLLPSPETRGPGARYSQEHVERIRMIKRLQLEHLPLAEIRKILEKWAAEGKPSVDTYEARNPARDYVRNVLGKRSSHSVQESLDRSINLSARRVDFSSGEPSRSQWERVVLAQDIELHIRRPLSRVQNKKVERLLASARDILREEL